MMGPQDSGGPAGSGRAPKLGGRGMMQVRGKGTGRVGRRHTRVVEAGAAGRPGLQNRWMALVVFIAAVALAVAPIASAREFSPYVLMADPLPANPASRPGHFLVIGAGPVAADVQSTNWNARQVAEFLQGLADENAQFPANLPQGLEEFRTAAAARASFTIFGIDLTYAPMMLTTTGFLSDDVVEALQALNKQESPTRSITLDGSWIELVAWQEVAVRAALGVPVLPRLLGLRSLVVGGSVHWMQGSAALQGSARGTYPPAPDGRAVMEAVLADKGGSGLAYDVGFMAELSRWLSVEGAYVGVGQLKWEEAKKEVSGWDGSGYFSEPPQPVPFVYDLPASTVLALRLRPVGPVELLLGYARIGVNKPDGFGRLNGELSLRLPLVQPSIGMVQDDGEPSYLYGKLRLGIGGTAITVKAVNLEALGNPEQAKTFGLSASVTLGF